jgi:hypothetical protein
MQYHVFFLNCQRIAITHQGITAAPVALQKGET